MAAQASPTDIEMDATVEQRDMSGPYIHDTSSRFFGNIQPSEQHYDVALVFAKQDAELANEIMEEMSSLELKDGIKPKICLSDDPEFTPSAVDKAEPIVKVCTLVFVVLTEHLHSDSAAMILREEAIGLTRLAPREEFDTRRRYCVRPLHTLSENDRRGVYRVPCGLTSIDSIDWYQYGKPFFTRKIKQLLEFYLPYRLKREMQNSSTEPIMTSRHHPGSGDNSEFTGNPSIDLSYQPCGQPQHGNNGQSDFSATVQKAHTTGNTAVTGVAENESVSINANVPRGEVGHCPHPIVPPSNEEAGQVSSLSSATNTHTRHSDNNDMIQNTSGGSVMPPQPTTSTGSVVNQSLRYRDNHGALFGCGCPPTNDQRNVSTPTDLNNDQLHSGFLVPQEDNLNVGQLRRQSNTVISQESEPVPQPNRIGRNQSAPVSASNVSEGDINHVSEPMDVDMPSSLQGPHLDGNHKTSHSSENNMQPTGLPTLGDTTFGINGDNKKERNSTRLQETEDCSIDGSSASASTPQTIPKSESPTKSTSVTKNDQSDHLTQVKTVVGEPVDIPTGQARTPGDGSDDDAHSKTVSSQTSSSKTSVKAKDEVDKQKSVGTETEPELIMKYDGAAHRSAAKCAAPNKAVGEKEVPPSYTSGSTPSEVIHYHYMAGQLGIGSHDPNIFFTGAFSPGYPPPNTGFPGHHPGRHPGQYPGQYPGPAPATTQTIGGQAPINFVNCQNVQIGPGQMVFGRGQGTAEDPGNASDEDISFASSTSDQGDAPPPYSQHDPAPRKETSDHSYNNDPCSPATHPKQKISGQMVTADETLQLQTRQGDVAASRLESRHGTINLADGNTFSTSLAQDCAPSIPLTPGGQGNLRRAGVQSSAETAMSELEGNGSDLGTSDFSSWIVPSLHDTGEDLKEMMQSLETESQNAKGEITHSQLMKREVTDSKLKIHQSSDNQQIKSENNKSTNPAMRDKDCSFKSMFCPNQRREDVFMNTAKSIPFVKPADVLDSRNTSVCDVD